MGGDRLSSGAVKMPSAPNLVRMLGIKNPIVYEIGPGREVESYADRTVIRVDLESRRKAMPLLLAQARLGEQDPLLSTFFFRRDGVSVEEQAAAQDFCGLCSPLQEAWGYGVLRAFAPEVYGMLVVSLFGETDETVESGRVLESAGDFRSACCAVAIAAANPALADSRHAAYRLEAKDSRDVRAKRLLNTYIATLKRFAAMDPDPGLYVRLVKAARTGYSVGIEHVAGDASRRYAVRLPVEKQA